MIFRDFQEAIARLAQDPRIHPGTQVELCATYDDGGEPLHIQEPLTAIVLAPGVLRLCAERVEPAVAR